MQRFGLLGGTLRHSYSPRIHALLGDYDYRLFEIRQHALEDFLQSGPFDGLNVTIPYKTAVIPYCAELSETARAIGSVNTLLRRPDGTLFGDNTDAAGFAAMLDLAQLSVAGRKVLVLGSGGAALAVRYVLAERKAGQIVTISRSGEDNYENLSRHRDAFLIVNCTPLGMFPNNGSSPLDLKLFPSCYGVLDLVYNPARTALLQQAAERELLHLGGLTMLVHQAAAASELFTAKPVARTRCHEIIAKLRRDTENIILIGMPGCGKTTLGQQLAEKLKKPFVDADALLVERAGCSIPDLFAKEGEAGFRARETAILRELGAQSSLVIATGGGCVTRLENRAPLRQNGILLWLDRKPEKLAREGRPLSEGADLQALYESRFLDYSHFADGYCNLDELEAQNPSPEALLEALVEEFSYACATPQGLRSFVDPSCL